MARYFAVFIAPLLVQSAAVTPVEKVLELLKKLSAQVEEEGKAEATTYDKYACFCKETADGKVYAIETSEKKIGALTAKIEELDGEINSLNLDITALGAKITVLTDTISSDTAARNAEHATYVANEKNMSDALSAIDRAIEALEASKSAMAGKTELEAAAFTQAKTVVSNALKLLGRQPGEAYEYGYHSNEIIAVLKDLKITFTKNKNELDQAEFEANSFFEKRKLGMENEKKFAEEEKAEKTATVESKTEAKQAAEGEKTAEADAMEADQDFLKVLKEDCEAKGSLWDQRSKTRAAELTALAEAIEALQTGVEPNWGANRKLVDLQEGASSNSTAGGHWEWIEDKPAAGRAPSFLQLRSSRTPVAVTRKALQLLAKASEGMQSPLLSAVLLKARVSEDHFVKVRSLIKDLVARLEADKMNEATTKSFCDTSMKQQITTRDTTKEDLEDIESKISLAEAQQMQLESEIAALSKAIAANEKALNEATIIRTEESAANKKTISEAGAGKAAVELALSILRKFYDSQGVFLQKVGYVPYVAPDANREGKTVGDLAPDVFSVDYKGKQQESKGVIGLLEVILADFERSETTVTNEEQLSQEDFEELESDMNKDTELKNGQIATKQGQLTETKDDLVSLKDDKATKEATLGLTLDELEKLKKMCVDGEETYAERVAKREKEIEALKEALQILDTWQE